MKHPIPDAALDSDIAILGRKGGGKTITAKGLVERLLGKGRRVLVLDPLGVWAGLRTAADGEKPGFPIAIFGGAHADMPLEPAAAVAMADVLARENVPAVIDLSDLSKAAQNSFLQRFLHELRRVNTEALTLVLEEADVWAPQNPMGDDSKALHGEIDWIARRGRSRGFRLITVTQRPARLSKDVLTQAATLIIHKLPAPQDRDAVKAWVEGNGDREQSRKVFDTLASLETGQAWVWAPDHGILDIFRFPMIKTLDTSATPKAGERKVATKTLAQVDVSAIRAALQVVQVERKPAGGAGAPAGVSGKRADKILVDEIAAAEQRGYERGLADGWAMRKTDLKHITRTVGAARLSLSDALMRVEEFVAAQIRANDPDFRQVVPTPEILHVLPPDEVGRRARALGDARRRAQEAKSEPRPSPKTQSNRRPADGAPVTPARKKLLDAIAWLSAFGNTEPTRAQVAFIAGVSGGSGAYANNLSILRGGGLIDYPQPNLLKLTNEGWEIAERPDAAPRHADVMAKAAERLGPALMKIARIVAAHHPAEMSRAQIAEEAGASATSGAFANNLSKLSSLGFVTYPRPGWVRADDALFPDKPRSAA